MGLAAGDRAGSMECFGLISGAQDKRGTQKANGGSCFPPRGIFRDGDELCSHLVVLLGRFPMGGGTPSVAVWAQWPVFACFAAAVSVLVLQVRTSRHVEHIRPS